MSLVLRIISVCILGGLFIIFLFYNFFSDSQTIDAPHFSGVFETYNTIQQIENSGSIIQKQDISLFETLYLNQDLSIQTGTGEKLEISLENPGIYISSFRDLRKKYSFSGLNYTIEQEGIGEIFIDTQSYTGSVLVMPLNTSAKIILHNDAGEEYTTVFLSPHMYIEFQPVRGKFLKNTDVVRIQTVYNLGYMSSNISHIYDEIFLLKYEKSINAFLFPVLEFIKEKDENFLTVFNTFKNQSVSKIPGQTRIERYMNLFVNKEKKLIFYKNIILEGFIELVNQKDISNSNIRKVQKDIDALQLLDTASYEEIISMRDEIIVLLNASYEKDDSISKISMASLGGTNISEKFWLVHIFAFSLFSSYDSEKGFIPEISQKYLQAFQDFISIENLDEEHKNLRYQYFSFFLEKQLLFSLEKENAFDNIPEIIDILSKYIRNANIAYSSSKNLQITGLYIYNEILEKIDIFLRTTFFQSERSKDNLLILHTIHKASVVHISDLKSEAQNIFKVYEKNKQYLDSNNARDTLINTEIQASQNHLLEYFSALENYESYTSLYDISKQNILNIDLNNSEDYSLSKEKIEEYFSNFVGVNVNPVDIEINNEEYYYSLKNVYISGKNFSFDIYPFVSYKMQNIVIDGVPSSFVYKLGVIESEWKEKIQTATKEEKEKYDFTRFFLITFFERLGNTVEEYIAQEVQYNEDTTEIVLKRDILLGTKGEFSSIKTLLPIEYSNLRLVKNSEYYDIFIDNSAFNITKKVEMGSDIMYNSVFNGEYVLNTTDHYFKNISMDIFLVSSGEKQKLFGSKSLVFQGKINLSDFNSFFTQFFDNVDQYNESYQILVSRYPENSIDIYYSILGNKMSFKFDFKEKNYTILFAGNMIDKIYEGNKNILSQSISPNNILQYLPE